ncbi:MAG TPA: chorismate mutase [Tepidiformaceae bacterium]|nr:chorismate mutase [Tepidiformaceae bacterium]
MDGTRRIEHWRTEIDRVDEDLLRLFNERAHYAIEIGLEKRRLGLPIEVPEREAAIIRQMVADNHGPLDGEAVERLFEAVIAESRIAEEAMLSG